MEGRGEMGGGRRQREKERERAVSTSTEQETICPEAHPNLSELAALNWLALPLLPGDREASWLIHRE